MDKPICPYCPEGVEMKPGGVNTLVHIAWWHCPKCNSHSPSCRAEDQKTAVEKALSAALQRYVEPLKPLALDEVTGSCEPCVFFEFHGAVSVWACDCVISSDFRHVEVSHIGRKTPLRMPIDTYGINWRCWLRRPTDEERQSVAWEESQ